MLWCRVPTVFLLLIFKDDFLRALKLNLTMVLIYLERLLEFCLDD